MSMIDVHRRALAGPATALHQFMSQYERRARRFYAFVEGRDDAPFYRPHIKARLTERWDVIFIPAGNRSNVLEALERFDWKTYRGARTGFFVDRDFADHLAVKNKRHPCLYITDGYSIENYLAAPKTFVDVVVDNLGMHGITPEERLKLRSWYQRRVRHYCTAVQPLMAQALRWKQRGETVSFGSISLNAYFGFPADPMLRPQYRSAQVRLADFAAKAGKPLSPRLERAKAAAQLRKAGPPVRTTRGKNLLEFIVSLMRYVQANPRMFCANSPLPAKARMNFGANQAVAHLAGHAPCPPSLAKFLARRLPRA